MTTNTLSVAMATYNGATFLADQLRSLAEQTVPPDELVVCDDQSADDTIGILEEFARTASFPVSIHRNDSRLGYIRNFGRASGLCKYDLISFCDQDDWWRKDKVELVRSSFSDPRTMLVYHNAAVVDVNLVGNTPLHVAEQEHTKLSVQPLSPWHHGFGMTQTFRSDLRRFDSLWTLSRSQISDKVDILSHDHWYMFLALVFGKVLFLDEPLVSYRQHQLNEVGSDPGKRRGRTKLLSRFEHYGRKDERSVEAARSRARVLREIGMQEPRWLDQAEAVASSYDRFAERLGRRFATYSRPHAVSRLASLMSGWTKGDYRGWPWGFDRRSVLRDLYSGVLLSRVDEPSA